MRFRTLPIVAILFIAAAMIVQFAISFSLEREHVREVVEYKNLWRMKQFYETYRDADEKLSPVMREISWTNNLTFPLTYYGGRIPTLSAG